MEAMLIIHLLSRCRLLSRLILNCILLLRGSPTKTQLEVDLFAALTAVSRKVARGSAKELFENADEQSSNDRSVVSLR